jgi:hypothetical protein
MGNCGGSVHSHMGFMTRGFRGLSITTRLRAQTGSYGLYDIESRPFCRLRLIQYMIKLLIFYDIIISQKIVY